MIPMQRQTPCTDKTLKLTVPSNKTPNPLSCNLTSKPRHIPLQPLWFQGGVNSSFENYLKPKSRPPKLLLVALFGGFFQATQASTAYASFTVGLGASHSSRSSIYNLPTSPLWTICKAMITNFEMQRKVQKFTLAVR